MEPTNKIKMSKEADDRRRRFFGTVALNIAAASD
jgi:hypothetical protein